MGLGCTLSFSAFADGRATRDLPLLAAQERITSVFLETRPADETQLAQLHGGMGAPLAVHRPGVILWDEPRPGVPPSRAPNTPSDSASITGTASILRR